MGKKVSGPGTSSSLTSTRHPRKNVAHICKPALAVPEGLSERHRHKGSNDSAEQYRAAAARPPERSPSKPFPIVGVGASAGGLEAFSSFLKPLPVNTGMAFVFVQHMDPAHESLLHRLLAKNTSMPVVQVEDGVAVRANRVYVIPPNRKMTIHKGRLRLVVRPGGESRHTPIDCFFSSLAQVQQGMAIGVILSGIGSDGTKGLQSIKAEGGITFAQDRDSAKFPGMPLSAVAAGCVDLVLSPDRIAGELARIRRQPYLQLLRSPATVELREEDAHIGEVLRVIRSATGVDSTDPQQKVDAQKEAKRVILGRHASAGLVVDASYHILSLIGDASAFLRPTPGKSRFDLRKLIRRELMVQIRAAMEEAKQLRMPAHRENVSFKRNGHVYRTALEVVPIPGHSPKGADFLVLFQNQFPEIAGRHRHVYKRNKAGDANEVERLRQDLASSQRHLRSVLEGHDAASEELRAADEELLTSNEELQSTNEELQTAQEEVQSANEELTNLNEELRNRNLELSQTAHDLTGVLNASEIPILILGSDRRIRLFTPAAGKLLNLVSTDVGRPIDQIRPNVDIPDLAALVSEVIKNKHSVEREVRDERGHWYAFRMRPHQLMENRVEAILTVVDINDFKQSSTAVVETVRESLLVLDTQFRITSANRAFYEKFHLQLEEVENCLLFELGQGQWNFSRLRELLEKVLTEKKEVVDFEVEHDFPTVGHKIISLSAHQLYQGGIESQKILLVMEDITERRAAEEKIHQLLAQLTTAREDEGKRIARELHDILGPRLALLNLKVSELGGRLSSQPDLARALDEIRSEISNAGKITHDISHELHPSALSQLGLAATLEAACAVFSKRCGTAINFSGESVPESLPGAVELCLYRVALASLENIRQHAQAKTASVRLAGTGPEMGMVIQDFGRGFDLHAARRGCGLGLVSMEERVRLVNGKLSLNSQPGQGTRVEVRIPLRRV